MAEGDALPGDAAAGRTHDRRIRVRHHHRVAAAQADARPSVPGQLHGRILTYRPFADPSHTRRRGAPAQSALPVGGREGGTLEGFRHQHYGRVVAPQAVNRLRNAHEHTGGRVAGSDSALPEWVWDHPAMFFPRSRRPLLIAAPPTAPTAPTTLVIALVIALAAGSCGPAGPTPTAGSPTLGDQPGFSLPLYSPGPTPTPEDPVVLYARIEQQVQGIRGLTAMAPISPKVLDEAGLMASLRD